MQEMRNNKKPIIYYWIIAGIIIILLNILFFPSILNKQVKEIDYGSFMKMTEEHDIGYVEIGDEQIIFTDKDQESTYKTGKIDDPDLVERLYESGAESK